MPKYYRTGRLPPPPPIVGRKVRVKYFFCMNIRAMAISAHFCFLL